MENSNQNDTYLNLLEDALKKKNIVLDKLLLLTQEQETLISAGNVEEEEFLLVIDKKEEQISLINQLDEGFDQLYQRVKNELIESKDKYVTQIVALQVLIREITDKSVRLQTCEVRNRNKLEHYLQTKRKEIKDFKVNNKTVSNYYKNMNVQQQESYFFDKKK